MKSIVLLVAMCISLSLTACNAQIKNAKTTSIKIYGNCEMCESKIEKVGNVKKVAKVDWNKDTKMASITYDSTKTNQDEILKRIALAGYDSDQFLAPDNIPGTVPEKMVYDYLSRLRIKFDFQYHLPENAKTKYTESDWIPDFLLPDFSNTLIETYGTYWHTISRVSDQIKKVYWQNMGCTIS